MEIAAQYAKALYETVVHNPSGSSGYLKNLRASLTQRGHVKLLPKIFTEYQKLETKHKRSKMHRTVTPHMLRTKVLLELYQKLTEVN